MEQSRLRETWERWTAPHWWCSFLGCDMRDILIPRPPLLINGRPTWVPPTEYETCRRCGRGHEHRRQGWLEPLVLVAVSLVIAALVTGLLMAINSAQWVAP